MSPTPASDARRLPDAPGFRLLLVADGFATRPERTEAVLAAVRAGARLVQLRDHEAEPETFGAAARKAVGRLREVAPEVRVFLNGVRLVDEGAAAALAEELGAGLHPGRRADRAAALRAAHPDLGLSVPVHAPAEARAAATVADLLVFAPVFATPSKPGRAAAGLGALAETARRAAPVPVFALGGVTPARAGACRRAGAYGVATRSGLLDASDPAAAAAAFLDALAR